MNVEFASNELRRRFEDHREGSRAWGDVVARHYIQRVGQIANAPDLRLLTELRSLRVHRLHGPRSGQWSSILHGRWRLVFTLPEPGTVMIQEVSNHYDD